MTLRLRRRPEITDTEAYMVLCGNAAVGVMSRVPHGPCQGQFHWSITAVYMEPLTRGGTSAMAPTREEAMRRFAARFREWLDWAGLREIEAGEALAE